MEQYIKQLTHYNNDLSHISHSLQKQEKLINLNDIKAQQSTERLKEENNRIEQEEYELALKFQALFEQSAFYKTILPELNQAKEKREKLGVKLQQYQLKNYSLQHQEKMLNQRVNNLPIEKQKLFSISSQRIFKTNSSLDTNERDENDELKLEDKEMIEKIAHKYRKFTMIDKQHRDSAEKQNEQSDLKKCEQLQKRKIRSCSSGKITVTENLTLSNLAMVHDCTCRNGIISNSPYKKMEGIPNPNKSFYLLHNKRLIDSVVNLTEITREELGGEYTCNCLLKAYHNNIIYTEHVRSKSTSSARDISKYSHRERRTKEKYDQGHIPTRLKNGRIIQNDLISVAVETDQKNK